MCSSDLNIHVDDINIYDAVAGLNESSKSSVVNVFPNPTTGKIQFNLPVVSESSMISLYSALGNQVMEVPVKGNSTIVDISGLPVGIYFYRVLIGNEKPVMGRLIRK